MCVYIYIYTIISVRLSWGRVAGMLMPFRRGRFYGQSANYHKQSNRKSKDPQAKNIRVKTSIRKQTTIRKARIRKLRVSESKLLSGYD